MPEPEPNLLADADKIGVGDLVKRYGARKVAAYSAALVCYGVAGAFAIGAYDEWLKSRFTAGSIMPAVLFALTAGVFSALGARKKEK